MNYPVDIDEKCLMLRDAILNGQVDMAAKYASELAKLKVNLKIEHKQEGLQKKVEIKIFNNNNNLNCEQTSEMSLNTKQTSVFDLKKEISSRFKIAIDQQVVIINDISTNDNDFIEIYGFINGASNSEPNQFVVHIFYTSFQSESTDTSAMNKNKCDECSFKTDNEMCQKCSLNEQRKRLLEEERQMMIKKQVSVEALKFFFNFKIISIFDFRINKEK